MPDAWQTLAVDAVTLNNATAREPADARAADELLTSTVFRDIAAGRAGERVGALERHLTEPQPAGRDLFLLFAYHPDTVLRDVVPQIRVESTWAVTVCLYEAWWRLAATGRLSTVEPRGQQAAAGYLARTRWLLYTWPFHAGPGDSGLTAEDLIALDGSRATLVTRARQAREDWLTVLDTVEDHSLLLADITPENDIRRLLSHPINVPALNAPRAPAVGDPVDKAVWRHTVRLHLLPRFAVGAAWQLAWRLTGGLGRGALVTAALAFLTALTLLGLGLGRHWPHDTAWMLTIATLAAGVGYTAVTVAGISERAASWPWLLRQPASAMLGVVALLALQPDWWQASQPRTAVIAAGILVALATGYLTIEAGNHGVSRGWPLLRRVTAVAGLGAIHAVLISTIALRWLAPALSEGGADMTCLWSPHGCPAPTLPPGPVFALAAAWCFAAGVFSQILWDDQPYTAPLAHLGWRKGR
ncbi:hypothetical protein AB0K00_21780 [Dactylosporangium sp. NPDC049525]|uniref:hypothetical protein n=1 Tax=Dactylosporangium sp. NPDC049525 TaxID=3154730 RepID=UPI00341AB94D